MVLFPLDILPQQVPHLRTIRARHVLSTLQLPLQLSFESLMRVLFGFLDVVSDLVEGRLEIWHISLKTQRSKKRRLRRLAPFENLVPVADEPDCWKVDPQVTLTPKWGEP